MTAEAKVILTAQDRTRAAVQSAKRGLQEVGTAGRSLQGVLARLGSVTGLGAIGGAFSGAAIAGFVKNAVDAVDALNDVADATGASVENISALEDVARRAGTSLDTVEGALIKFNGTLKDADPNSGAAAALKAIGLNAEELKKLDPAEALLKTAQALAGFADDGNKARIIQELFSKSIKEVGPFLKDLAEKGQLNATVTREQAEQAERFNKQIFELQTNIGDATRAIGLGMVPTLSKMLEQFSTGIEMAGGFGKALRLFGLANTSAANIGNLRKELDALQAKRARYAARGNADLLPDVDEQIADARKRLEFAKFLQRQAALEGSGGVLDANDARAKGGLPTLQFKTNKIKPTKEYDAELEMSRRAAEAYASSLQAMIGAQNEAADSLLELTPLQRTLLDIMRDPQWQAMDDPWKRTFAAAAESALAIEKNAASYKRLKDLIAAGPDAQLEKQRDDMLLLAQAFEKGVDVQGRLVKIDLPTYLDAVNGALGNLPEKADKAADELDQFWVGAARNIQSTIADALTDGFSDGGRNILADFGKLIERLIAQAVAADLAKRLFGADFASGKSGDIGGWLGMALNAAGHFIGGTQAPAPVVDRSFAMGGAFGNGEILTQPTLFRYASGGVLRMGLAGEAGDEGVFPLTRMANGKLGVYAMGAGQGGTVININMQIPPGTPAEQRASLAQQARQAMGALNRARRYG